MKSLFRVGQRSDVWVVNKIKNRLFLLNVIVRQGLRRFAFLEALDSPFLYRYAFAIIPFCQPV